MDVTMIVLDEPAGLFERLEHALNGLAKVVQLAPVLRASHYRAAGESCDPVAPRSRSCIMSTQLRGSKIRARDALDLIVSTLVLKCLPQLDVQSYRLACRFMARLLIAAPCFRNMVAFLVYPRFNTAEIICNHFDDSFHPGHFLCIRQRTQYRLTLIVNWIPKVH